MIQSKRKILFIGPFPPPYGGIANHTNLLYNSTLNKDYNLLKLNINLPGEIIENVSQKKKINFRKILHVYSKALKLLVQEKPEIAYITPQSFCLKLYIKWRHSIHSNYPAST